ncbi:APC family permease [Streptomyces anulatus]|uniref:APC family permease n=1 Tax=Streptomyces anulatus TaxID=1892 RepID=UPI00365928F8
MTERMGKRAAPPVLSADALSSVAYGPEAMLGVLVLAGTAGLAYSYPVAGTIVLPMFAVGLSYRQTIRAYPHGGGSHIVASDNLGRMPALIAAAGLMTDYVLTVAVSIASGIAAITSALPSLDSATAPLGVGVITLLLAGNLRGVRQAGTLFAVPTYAFIGAVFLLIGFGLADAADRGFTSEPGPVTPVTETVGLLLITRAFFSGATAMTGIEAISNAVPVFKSVEWRNTRTTLTWMVSLLITMFVGIVVLTRVTGVVPRPEETMLSQLARLSFGTGWMYVFVQAATAAVLPLAANTAYNDFPRVLSLLARDGYAPRIFMRLGDRLAYSDGIILLSIAAALVFVAFGGQTDTLIPLYAVGVFLAFTPRRREWSSTDGVCGTVTGARASASTPSELGCRPRSSSPSASASSPQAHGWRSSQSACSCWSPRGSATTTTPPGPPCGCTRTPLNSPRTARTAH